MPQMAPILWLPLLTLFFYLLIMLKTCLYFMQLNIFKPTTSFMEPSTNLNWLW